jgi:hypothetical protein
VRRSSSAAELGGDGEQVPYARRNALFSALDVAADERGDRKVLLAELVALARVGITALDHRTRASTIWWARQQGPAAGIASQRAAWSR